MALPTYGQNIEVATSDVVVSSTLPTYGQPIFKSASKSNLPKKGQIINQRIG